MTIPHRLLSKCVLSPSGCWLWIASQNPQGYGKAWYNGREYRAHRLFYILTYGPILDELVVRHTCDTPECVNPEHLKLGTHQDNTQDIMVRGNHRTQNQFGPNNTMSKLSYAKAERIKQLYATGVYSQRKLATIYEVTQNAIYQVLSGKTWRVS